MEIPFLTSEYDYYMIGSLLGNISNSADKTSSTWKPTRLRVLFWNQEVNGANDYPVYDFKTLNFDSDLYRGFSFYARIGFEEANSMSIRSFELLDDIDGYGSKPANQKFQMAIIAIPKGTDYSDVLETILSQIVGMESALVDAIGDQTDAITGAVSDAAQQLEDVINSQYDVEDGEDFDINDMTDEITEKMGLLSFSGDVLDDFVGLFDESNISAPVLTFPAFGMEVQGQMYQVWDSYDYDLRDLDSQFPVLMNAVRLVSGLIVWLLLFNYIAKVADEFLRS